MPKIKSAFPSRKKKPVCRQADTFPCGYSCKNQFYREKKSGQMKETECKKLLGGQAKTLMEWQKLQAERIEVANKKRGKAGLKPVVTTPALSIDQAKTQKLIKQKVKGRSTKPKQSMVDDPWDGPTPERVNISIQPKAIATQPKALPPAKPSKALPSVDKPLDIAEWKQFFGRKYRGEVTADEIKNTWERFKNSKEQIRATMSDRRYTIADIKKDFYSYHAKSKKEWVDSALSSMEESFIPSGSSRSLFGGREAIAKENDALVASWTDDKIQAEAEAIAKRNQESRERKEKTLKALENPQTLNDFDDFIYYKGEDKLTPEQLARYDELRAEAGRSVRKRQAEANQTKEIKASDDVQGISLSISEHVHSKYQKPLIAVSSSEMLPTDDYYALLKVAKEYGGYKGKKWGSVPRGYHFMDDDKEKALANAKAFMEAAQKFLGGETVATQGKTQRKSPNAQAQKLMDLAASLREKSTEELNRDRLANTSRRARMAASAEEYARENIAFADTLDNIAQAIADGNVKFLDKIATKADVAQLLSLAKRAKRNADHEWDKQNRNALYGQKEDRWNRPIQDSDIAYAQYPYPSIWAENMPGLVREIEKVKGLKMIANRLKKHPSYGKDRGMVYFDAPSQISDMRKIATVARRLGKKAGLYMENVLDDMRDYDRLQNMEIKNESELRAALREFLQYRGEKDKADPITQMERELIGTKIPGYFPTPKPLAAKVAALAGIEDGDRVLEPSAGKGSLLDAVKALGKDVTMTAIERNSKLSEILKAKGYDPIHGDFLDHDGQYDKIVMNPPFENGQDMDHVQKAYELLAPGGRLVAIMGAHGFFAGDKQSREFRDWLDDNNSVYEKLPSGSFKNSDNSTGVETYLVEINKPGKVEKDSQSTPNNELPANQKKWNSRYSSEIKDPGRYYRIPTDEKTRQRDADRLGIKVSELEYVLTQYDPLYGDSGERETFYIAQKKTPNPAPALIESPSTNSEKLPLDKIEGRVATAIRKQLGEMGVDESLVTSELLDMIDIHRIDQKLSTPKATEKSIRLFQKQGKIPASPSDSSQPKSEKERKADEAIAKPTTEKEKSDRELEEKFNQRFSRREMSADRIRAWSEITPSQLIRDHWNSPKTADEFEKYGERSGLWWKDTRTGGTFKMLEAMKTDLQALDTAHEIMGKSVPQTPTGKAKPKSEKERKADEAIAKLEDLKKLDTSSQSKIPDDWSPNQSDKANIFLNAFKKQSGDPISEKEAAALFSIVSSDGKILSLGSWYPISDLHKNVLSMAAKQYPEILERFGKSGAKKYLSSEQKGKPQDGDRQPQKPQEKPKFEKDIADFYKIPHIAAIADDKFLLDSADEAEPTNPGLAKRMRDFVEARKNPDQWRKSQAGGSEQSKAQDGDRQPKQKELTQEQLMKTGAARRVPLTPERYDQIKQDIKKMFGSRVSVRKYQAGYAKNSIGIEPTKRADFLLSREEFDKLTEYLKQNNLTLSQSDILFQKDRDRAYLVMKSGLGYLFQYDRNQFLPDGDRQPDPTSKPEAKPKPTPEPLIAGTPRSEAATASQELDDDYEFARKSAVPNAGEDLKGSARHIRNQWKGLKEAEADGTAETLVTRENLLKNEPMRTTELATTANHLSALTAHFVMQKFPPAPYTDKTLKSYKERTKEELRKQYYDAFSGLKQRLEQSIERGDAPSQTISDAKQYITDTVNGLRGQEVDSTYRPGEKTKDRYNPVANALITTYRALSNRGTTSVDGRLKAFMTEASKKYPDGMTPDQGLDHAMSVIEGKSIPAAFDASSTADRFNPYAVYVANAERKGGRVIDAQTVQAGTDFMLKNIGLRGIQYGNSVTDGERIHHLQKTAESFADLADILGLPDNFISLGGSLGLAIGARGKGVASAHYEPSTKVINLTRKSGVGALAHEWGHAMDHYIAGGQGRLLSDSLRFRSPTNEIETAMEGAIASMYESGFNDRLSGVLRGMTKDKKVSKKKADEYWKSREEKFARTFERYVQEKLDAQGRQNTYLTGLGNEGSDSLWPTREEVQKMTPAFDALITAIRKAAIAGDL